MLATGQCSVAAAPRPVKTPLGPPTKTVNRFFSFLLPKVQKKSLQQGFNPSKRLAIAPIFNIFAPLPRPVKFFRPDTEGHILQT
jgi:hypothetical protein